MHTTGRFRPQRKLLRAVADLHLRGYQRIRVVPYTYEGLRTWRCALAPASWISSTHGAKLADPSSYERCALYTSADESTYWEWEDDHHCSPTELADVFLRNFPELAAGGYGQDWLYAGWFQHMLHLVYPDNLPVAFLDSDERATGLGMYHGDGWIPLPPPGHAPPSSVVHDVI